jgi:hypothetical protein
MHDCCLRDDAVHHQSVARPIPTRCLRVTDAPGLGLLSLDTVFDPLQSVTRIHHGQTSQHPTMVKAGDVTFEVMPAQRWQNVLGKVLCCYLHGLFEYAAVLQALFNTQDPTHLTDFLSDWTGFLKPTPKPVCTTP